MSASLELGNGNWAVKSDALLGYKTINGEYYPREFSVTRATTATRVNPQGLVEITPYNLVSWSEQFDNAAWTKGLNTITANATTAPDGTLTADKFTQTPSSEGIKYQSIFQSIFIKGGINTTRFVYVKAAEINWIYVQHYDGISNNGVYFNINNGTIGNTIGSNISNQFITPIGDGWYKVGFTSLSASSSISERIQVALVNSNGGTPSYTGDGTSGIFIWGAQIVEGTEPLDYLPTTDRLDIARIDYSLGSANLLLEPQRTNLCSYSEEFNDATFWLRTAGVSVNANTSNSPSGTLTADTIVGATGTGGWATPNVLQRQIAGLSSSTTYTFSVYLKGSGSVTIQLRDQSTGIRTNLVCNLTSSWQRFELTRTTGATTTALGIVFGSATVNFDAWGAQFEAGAYATSYIPTTTASVTRNADSISRSNIYTNGLITDAGGTWFVEFRNNVLYTAGITQSQQLGLGNNTVGVTADNIWLSCTNGYKIIVWKQVAGSLTPVYYTTTENCKLAIKWNGSSMDIFQNGVKVITATSFTPTSLETLRTVATQQPYYINQMALYPTPLSDTECINLTTL